MAAVIGCIYEVWRSARKDRQRRRRAASGAAATVATSGSQRWQPQQYTESLVTATGVKTIGFKNVIDDDKRPNGTHVKVPGAKEYKPLPNAEPKDLINDKKVHIKGAIIHLYIEWLIPYSNLIAKICTQFLFKTSQRLHLSYHTRKRRFFFLECFKK